MTTTTSNALTIDDLEDACPHRGHLLALRLAGGTYGPFAYKPGPVTLDRPAAMSFPVGDLARPRAR